MDEINQIKIKKTEDGIKFCVKVIPNSSKCEIAGIIENCLKIKLISPPVEGKANKECIIFLSKILNISKTSIKIISGETSKTKTIFIKGDPEKLFSKILSLISDRLYQINNGQYF